MVGLQGFPQNTYILRTNSTLQYEDGTLATVANDVYNHHVQIFDIGKMTDPLFQCGKIDPIKPNYGMKMPGSYFGGSASDGAPSIFNTPDGMFNSGYFLGKQSKVIMSAELINYAKETKKIYAVTEIDYLPGDTPGMMDTSVGIMSVNQCDSIPNPFLRPPVGKKIFDMRSKDITILQDGFMLSRRGHMHDGGTGMVLKINDKVVCDSKAEYGGSGTFKGENSKDIQALSGMKECNDPVPIKKGDSLSIEAYFDLDKHPP
jgi:Stress up-regulated Nod 19